MKKLTNKTGYFLTALFLVLVGTVESARADFVTHNFTGEITSISGTLFGLSLSIGQPVQGSFTYDTSQPPSGSPVSAYIQPPPSGMSVVISGLILQSLNYNSFQLVNDGFGYDNINGFFSPIAVGVEYGGSGFINFGLTDFTQTAFSSMALPLSLNVASFSQREGSVFDGASGGLLKFSIDTLELSESCEADLAQCQADFSQCGPDLTTCMNTLGTTNAALSQCNTALTAATADADNDGLSNRYDHCSGTTSGAAIDNSGCSLVQFCSAINATTASGKTLCKKSDWKNDEPLMSAKEADCMVQKGGGGSADDLCVPHE
jgi:hypothetical protein